MFSRRCRGKYCRREIVLGTCVVLLLILTLRTSFSDTVPPAELMIQERMQTRNFLSVEVNITSPVTPSVRLISQRTRDKLKKFPTPPENKLAQKLNKTVPKVAQEHGCDSWYGDYFQDNLRVISSYPRGNADQYMWKMGANLTSPKQTVTSFPVIVTAANSGFYHVTQALLKSIHELVMPKYKDVKIIFYDMGLQASQVQTLKKYCKCEVRRFPFEDYPDHVKQLKTYTWKPIIVQTVMMEYGWVWWMDSSVRFFTGDLDAALKYSIDNHMLFFTYGPVLAVAYHTDAQTMNYLGEDPCKFRHLGEIEATFVLFHYDDVTKVLVDAWTACALNPACMCPPGTSEKLHCSVAVRKDGRCHRFDQAVLSVMIRRLYHDSNDYPTVDVPFHIHDIKRGHRIQYFPAD